MMYRLQRRQVVGGDLADVFGFFKSPFNLEAITPPWLGFHVLHASDPEVREGTRIAYRQRLHGFRFRWESSGSTPLKVDRCERQQCVTWGEQAGAADSGQRRATVFTWSPGCWLSFTAVTLNSVLYF